MTRTRLPIETPRLRLDRLTRADAPTFHRLVTQPEVGRMLYAFPPDWSVPAAEAFIDRWQDVERGCYRFAVRRDGRLIGSVGGATGGAAPPVVFYFLDPAEAGRGYATEALLGFLPHFFASHGRAEVQADVFTDNPASARVLEKVGFRHIGEGIGESAARLEPHPVWLYRLSQSDFGVRS
ncbi:GNAT family N-acetyltransferase [Pontivivens ytuae]|uniref:GNAT family N-acetyltransferase n=1 Tax=Pontivivens ytuae TaxID=2789856 RepID=A0A7S9QBJ7_9RHOB|nr:GNAT family N-acetyltransferase [Pontivivens ytuae]QPH53238.1 GNAT family N-acetyltransferase [Pontivivens ytuae]